MTPAPNIDVKSRYFGECPMCLNDGVLLPVIAECCYGISIIRMCLACRLSPPDEHGQNYGVKSWEGLRALDDWVEHERQWEGRRTVLMEVRHA